MAKTENLTKADERRLLKKYLCRYFKAKEKKAVLRDRLENLQRELRRSEGGEASSLAAMEIEARIRRQTDKEEKHIIEIMDVIDLLPADSMERSILELRHIDCRTWREIHKAVHLTPSPCYERYNKGLDQLLAKSKVRHALGLAEK